MKNFLLIGEMGSGKDTLAALLPGYQRLAFGDNIRKAVHILNNDGVIAAYQFMQGLFNGNVPPDLTTKLSEFSSYANTDNKNRQMLQDLGTYARLHDDGIWIRSTREMVRPRKKYVVTDCRRYSEFMAFPDWTKVYIDADLEVRKERIIQRDGIWKDEWSNHPAEQEIKMLKDMADIIVVNNGTLDQLRHKVKFMLSVTELLPNTQMIIDIKR